MVECMHACTSSSDWFTGLVAAGVTGQRDYFGFGSAKALATLKETSFILMKKYVWKQKCF